MIKKDSVLILDIGYKDNPKLVHNDYENNINSLKKNYPNLTILQANLYKDDIESLFDIYNILVVDTHHIRFWQKEWKSRAQTSLLKLNGLCKKHGAQMVNNYRMFKWNSSKADYLQSIANSNNELELIPTSFVSPKSKYDIIEDLIEHKNIVIKPSTGARALGISFVSMIEDNKFLVKTPTTPDMDIDGKGAISSTNYFDKDGLIKWFEKMRDSFADQKILVQKKIGKHDEISVVLLTGQEPYGVLRTKGVNTNIAHESFGGKNIPMQFLPIEFVSYANKIRQSMPDNIAKQHMMRIDILKEKDSGKLYPLEIESAGPRLFITESANIDPAKIDIFGKMLGTIAMQVKADQRQKRLNSYNLDKSVTKLQNKFRDYLSKTKTNNCSIDYCR